MSTLKLLEARNVRGQGMETKEDAFIQSQKKFNSNLNILSELTDDNVEKEIENMENESAKERAENDVLSAGKDPNSNIDASGMIAEKVENDLGMKENDLDKKTAKDELLQAQKDLTSNLNTLAKLVEQDFADDLASKEEKEMESKEESNEEVEVKHENMNDTIQSLGNLNLTENMNTSEDNVNLPNVARFLMNKVDEENEMNHTNLAENVTVHNESLVNNTSDSKEVLENQFCQHPKFGGMGCDSVQDEMKKEANDRSDNIQFIQVNDIEENKDQEKMDNESKEVKKKASSFPNVAKFLTRFVDFFSK